jgi:hypothetical protein
LFGGGSLLVAVLHLGPLKPMLGRLFGSSVACPVSIKGLTAQEIETQRANASRALAGDRPARSRAAGPFALTVTKRADVSAWATAAGIACVAEQSDTALRCSDVPSAALGTSNDGPVASDVFFRFAPDGTLVAVDVMRRPCDGACAESLAREIITRIERDVGEKAASHGAELSAATLDAPGIRMNKTEFRFADFAVDVSVSRLEAAGGPLTVREQYRAVAGTAANAQR